MAVVVAAPPALSGDLALYHTTDPLLANSPLAPTLEGWEDGAFRAEEKRVYHHYIDWDPQRENPAVLDIHDLPAITASRQFFVRKVLPGRSRSLMDALDQAIG